MHNPSPDRLIAIIRARLKNAEWQQRIIEENVNLRAELTAMQQLARSAGIDPRAKPPETLVQAWRARRSRHVTVTVSIDDSEIIVIVDGPARPPDVVREYRDWQQIIAAYRQTRQQARTQLSGFAFADLPEGVQACRDAGEGTLVIINARLSRTEARTALNKIKHRLTALVALTQVAAISLVAVSATSSPLVKELRMRPPPTTLHAPAPTMYANRLHLDVRQQAALRQRPPQAHATTGRPAIMHRPSVTRAGPATKYVAKSKICVEKCKAKPVKVKKLKIKKFKQSPHSRGRPFG